MAAITKDTFAYYVKQYKDTNPGISDIELANHFFNYGYWYGRRKKKIEKFDIPPLDPRYKANPTKFHG